MADEFRVTISYSWTIPAFSELSGPCTWTNTRHWPDVILDANRMGIVSETHAEKWVEDLLIEAITLGGQRELPDNFRAYIHATHIVH